MLYPLIWFYNIQIEVYDDSILGSGGTNQSKGMGCHNSIGRTPYQVDFIFHTYIKATPHTNISAYNWNKLKSLAMYFEANDDDFYVAITLLPENSGLVNKI